MQKRLEKKLRKHQHILYKETGVKPTNEPTPHLAICNAGQINGITEALLIDSFSRYGDLTDIFLLPGKSVSFLSFKNLDSAVTALNESNGKLNIAQDNKPIFLSYVECLPEYQGTKIWNEKPPGLILLDNYITEAEEDALLEICDFPVSGSMKHRQVKHYGYEFRYDTNNIDKDKPLKKKIPSNCQFLLERLKDSNLSINNFSPDQLTINRYTPGQGIPHHVDTHSAFEDPIISLSLQSDIVMEFRKDHKHVCVLLPRRSLLTMSGESRYDWTHGIVPRKFDTIFNGKYDTLERHTRTSFTFRKVLGGECDCLYKSNCDSYRKNNQIPDDKASNLEKLHVHEVYENIADHFSETRHKPWPNVLDFIDSFGTGSLLIDAGCGNGKYLVSKPNIFKVGCDRSCNLLEVCKERGFESFVADCLDLPLRNGVADGVISIAVIHHLASEKRRLKAINEIVRILKSGGRALIYVWAKNQMTNNEKSSYIKQDRKNRKGNNLPDSEINDFVQTNGLDLPVHRNRTQFQNNDILVPWKLKEKDTFLRFYHVFNEGELEDLCRQNDEICIVKSYYDQGNHCVIIQRK